MSFKKYIKKYFKKKKIKPLIIFFFSGLILVLIADRLINYPTEVFFHANMQRTGVFKVGIIDRLRQGKWKFKAVGGIIASPVIDNGMVYFGSWDNYLYALNSRNGKIKWKFGAEDEIPFSPAIDKNTVYAGSGDGYLYALDKRDGEKKWKFKIDNSLPIVTSPIVHKDMVYCGARDGNLYAVDAQTGKERWRFKTGEGVDSSPAILGDTLYFGSFDGNFYALDRKTGQEKWRFKTESKIDSSPAIVGKTVYFGGTDSHLYALDVASGKERWRFKTGGAIIDSSPCAINGIVYIGSLDQHLYAIDAKTGKEKWKFKAGGGIISSPATNGKMVYFGSQDNYLYAIDAQTGKEKWRFKTADKVDSSPALAGSIVYFGGVDNYLYAIDAQTGKIKNDNREIKENKIKVFKNTEIVPQADIYELTVEHDDEPYKNPWVEVEVLVKLTDPQGKTILMPGFYYDTDLWKVRFSPKTTGDWKWELEFVTPFGVLKETGSFKCELSDNPGFIKIHPDNPFRLIFENGKLFNGIGISDALIDYDVDGNRNPFDNLSIGCDLDKCNHVDLDTYLKTYGIKGAGFNLFRWSVNNASFSLWSDITPEGNRYKVREGMWGDELVKKLRGNGFRIWLTFFGFDPPFTDLQELTGGQPAINHYLKYIIARFGAYVDVWELMNEASVPNNWIVSVAEYLKSSDPYKHLVTTSWEKPELAQIDINSPHWYEKESEFESDFKTYQKILKAKSWDKPVVIGEQGNMTANWDERSALRMRLRSWTAFFAEGMLIFWNSSFTRKYTGNPANLYIGSEERQYIRALQDFTGDVPADVKIMELISGDKEVRAYGLQSSQMILGYLHHFDNHDYALSTSINLNLPKEGIISWLDPASGRIISSEFLNAGDQLISTPNFVTDLAFKVRF